MTVPSLARRFGGPTAKARGLAAALRADGHSVTVIGCDDTAATTATEIRLGALGHFHSTPIPRRVAPIVHAVRRADVVHVLGLRDPVGTIACIAARRRGIPYVLEPEGMLPGGGRSLTLKRLFDSTVGRGVVSGAASIVATSSLEASHLKLNEKLPSIVVRPNGVEISASRAPAGDFRRRIGVGAEVPLVLAIGRITRVKRFDLLVEAVALIPGAHCVIAGTDEGDGTLQVIHRNIAARGLAPRVKVIGDGLWGDDKDAALLDADVFVMPSASESFGLAAAEAACAGVPVVATEACGVVEWLPADSCRVVPVDNALLLAEALRSAIDESGQASRAERAAAATSVLGWGEIATRQLELYRRVTSA
jgi:glycosyltransferase involved in cell wall biosynthesis